MPVRTFAQVSKEENQGLVQFQPFDEVGVSLQRISIMLIHSQVSGTSDEHAVEFVKVALSMAISCPYCFLCRSRVNCSK